MRIAVVVAMSALVAGCSSTSDDATDRSGTAPPSTSTTALTTPTTSSAPTVTASGAQPPSPGASVTEVIGWIEGGTAVDQATFHSATRADQTTDLGQDIAFASPSGTANCMTDARSDGALACLVDLIDPPPRPADVYGQWKGGWVDFGGMSAEVGSAHGDPGRFGTGTGRELPYGHTLSFGDYRCRSDPAGVYCVNYAHRSAVKFADTGIETFGCLDETTAPADVGRKFSC